MHFLPGTGIFPKCKMEGQSPKMMIEFCYEIQGKLLKDLFNLFFVYVCLCEFYKHMCSDA